MSGLQTDRIHILHVDDDPSVTELLAAIFERDFPECTVHSSRDPDEALEVIVQKDIECAVLDYDMPEMNGIDLLRRIKSVRPALPVILFTGHGSEEIAATAIQAGVDGYVQKGGRETFGLLATQIRNLVTTMRLDRERHERTKELSVLHAATLTLLEDRSMEARLTDLTYTIPSGYQYPEHTAAQISVGESIYKTPNFRKTDPKQTSSLTLEDGRQLELTVSYTRAFGSDASTGVEDSSVAASDDNTPFLEEEQALLDSIANIVRVNLERDELIHRLSRTNAELAALIDNTPAVVYLKDADGRYLLVNDEFERRMGKPRAAVLGRTPAEVHDESFAELIEAHDQVARERGEPVEFTETVWIDGEPTTYLSIRVPLFDDTGELYAMYGISTDITAQTELAERNKRLLDRMTDAFFALDTDWRFTYLNETAEDVLDRSAAELLGTTVWETFPEAIDTPFETRYKEAMQTQEPVTFEEYYAELDAWFDVRAYPSPSGLSVYFYDITDRKRQREALAHREETLRQMHNIIADRERSFDEQVRDLLALGRSELKTAYGTLSEIRGDEYIFEIVDANDDSIEAGDIVPLSATNCEIAASNERTLVLGDVARDAPEETDRAGYTEWGIACYIGAPVYVGNKVYGTFCFYDTEPRTGQFSDWEVALVDLMSRWVTYELERQRTNDRLERQNERLESFASIVSHDLRNPLNVLVGSIELAEETGGAEQFERCYRAIERMVALIEDLLALARSGESISALEAVPLTAVTRNSWETVDVGGATLATPTKVEIKADRTRLQQLLENLIRNAIEHGGENVNVTVGDLPDGFYLEDDGPGIPASDREQVFESGYTTSQSGTGFGLSIVKSIADAHGWTVEIVKGSDGGARFEFAGVDRPISEKA